MASLEIFIVTHKRPQFLKRTIDSVKVALNAAQVNAHIEILLNGPDDSSREWLVAESNASTNVTLSFTQSSKTLGPSSARNAVAKTIKAENALFLDDDCTLPSHFFRAWVDFCEHHREWHVIGGPNLTPPNSAAIERQSGAVLGHPFASLNSSWRYRENNRVFLCSDIEITSTHLFVKKAVLEKVMFPVEFQTAEENAFLNNVQKAGFQQIWYCGQIFVWHERRPTIIQFAWQIFRYGRGRGQMVRDGFSFKWFHLVPALAVAFFAGSLAWPDSAFQFFYQIAAGVYCAALIVASIQVAAWLGPLLFFILHVSYIMGWWAGLLLRSSPNTESTLS